MVMMLWVIVGATLVPLGYEFLVLYQKNLPNQSLISDLAFALQGVNLSQVIEQLVNTSPSPYISKAESQPAMTAQL
jgi:hypothetical protein